MPDRMRKGEPGRTKVAREQYRNGKYNHVMNSLPTQPTAVQDMHVITLGACFDVHAEPALESAVLNVQEAQGKHIILNLQALVALDSRGLGKLFLTYHHLHRKRIRMSMIKPRPAVREILEFVNFPRIVPIYDSIEAAVSYERRNKESPGLHQGVYR